MGHLALVLFSNQAVAAQLHAQMPIVDSALGIHGLLARKRVEEGSRSAGARL